MARPRVRSQSLTQSQPTVATTCANTSTGETKPAKSTAFLSWTPSTRIRVLGWYIVLLAAAIVFGLFIQRSILLAQLNDEVEAQLGQEIRELEQLTGGRNPNTGEPFAGNVTAIFDTFLSRNIPVEGEALFTLVGGQPYASTVTPVQLLDDPAVVREWTAVETTTRSELDTSSGRVRYIAVPILFEEQVTGVFVVAIFLEEKRDDVDSVLQTGAIVYGSIFVVVSAAAWFIAGHTLRPIRLLTRAARRINDTNWSERIPVRGGR